MPKISELLEEATKILDAASVSDARRQAQLLLIAALKKDKVFLIAHSEYELTTPEQNLFLDFVARRARREPLQYITGRQEFYGLDFEVTPAVLIPRPETELIVETAIEILRGEGTAKICEVGTGSGCIVVSILKELNQASAIALDISESALEIARRNARRHKVFDRIDFKISDVFSVLENEIFDVIVSNPPYISLNEMKDLDPEVKNYEPTNALTDEASGLSIIEKIISEAPLFLKPRGFLIMEIGYMQAVKVRQMFSEEIWDECEILPDLQGIPRTVKARLRTFNSLSA